MISSWRTGPCAAGLAMLMVLFGSRGLETAEANGDTRTLTLHHLHTDENITITYKRDGRYDDDALKKLDHFLRDWRKDESTHMDPRLYDVVWEVAREFGKDKIIQVVCGYRSPSTNEMLRHRSRSTGVARFSQHTLGKAMDFYIQGASLEEIREAGLRLQRGGVGYYPTSGSPFVHLDVGNVRHWPRMTREQLARVFPNGRTVHIPSDGQPMSGYALALADIQKRGSSLPSPMSLAAAQSAGVDTTRSVHAKGLIASLFQRDDEEDGDQAPPSTAASAPRTFTLASLPDPAKTPDTAAARPRRTAALTAVTGDIAKSGEHSPWTTSGVIEPAKTEIHAPLSNPDNAPAPAPWPIREADKDRGPRDAAPDYAGGAKIASNVNVRSDAAGSDRAPSGAAASGPTTSGMAQRDSNMRDSAATAKKNPSRASGAVSVPIIKVVVATAAPGMRYDDPWLRAMMLAPRLYGSMTATLYGDPDFTELRSLMSKPSAAVAMSFSSDPYPGIKPNAFSGEAVVLLSTVIFSQRTAWLQ